MDRPILAAILVIHALAILLLLPTQWWPARLGAGARLVVAAFVLPGALLAGIVALLSPPPGASAANWAFHAYANAILALLVMPYTWIGPLMGLFARAAVPEPPPPALRPVPRPRRDLAMFGAMAAAMLLFPRLFSGVATVTVLAVVAASLLRRPHPAPTQRVLVRQAVVAGASLWWTLLVFRLGWAGG